MEGQTLTFEIGANVLSAILAVPSIIAAFYAYRATRQAEDAKRAAGDLHTAVNGRMEERIAAARAEGKLEAMTERRGSTPVAPVAPPPSVSVTSISGGVPEVTTNPETGVDNGG